MIIKRSAVTCAIAVALTVGATACGGSSSKSSTSSAGGASSATSSASTSTTAGTSSATGTAAASGGALMASGKGAPMLPGPGVGKGIGPMVGTPAAKAATAAGTAAGKKMGVVKNPPHPTVGYLDILGGIESADRAHNSVAQAFKAVGYKMVYCDGAGQPTKWTTCGDSLLAQGVKAIVLTGIDPSSIPTVVQKAKSAGVPIVDCCGEVAPGFAAAFFPNEPLSGKILAKALIAKLGSSGGDIAVANYPAPWASARTAQLTKMIKGTKVNVSANSVTDPANLVQGTQQTVTNQLTANPNLKALWYAFDTAGQAAAQAVASKFTSDPSKAPPIFTFHADPSTQTLMRKGEIYEVVDVNYDVTAWEAVNAIVEHFARHTPFPGYTDAAKYPGLGNPLSYQLVTKATLPPAGDYVAPRKDGVSYFLAKWKAEGLGS